MTQEKAQVDMERVEADYRGGILSVREVGKLHGVSHALILRWAKRHSWTRDLKARIHAKADELVTKQVVTTAVTEARAATERQIIDVNAAYIASVRGEHRVDIKRLRDRVKLLVDEFEGACDPELWSNIRALAAQPPLINATKAERAQQDRRAEALTDALNRATGFTNRLAGIKVLSDTLKTLVGLEREALGLDDKSAGDKPQGRVLSDVERAARLMAIMERARRAKAEADAKEAAGAAIATAKGSG